MKKKKEKEKRFFFFYFNPLFSMFKRLIDRDLYYLVIYFFANFFDRPYPRDYHKVYEVTYSVIDLYFMLLALINFQKIFTTVSVIVIYFRDLVLLFWLCWGLRHVSPYGSFCVVSQRKGEKR